MSSILYITQSKLNKNPHLLDAISHNTIFNRDNDLVSDNVIKSNNYSVHNKFSACMNNGVYIEIPIELKVNLKEGTKKSIEFNRHKKQPRNFYDKACHGMVGYVSWRWWWWCYFSFYFD